jgi:glycosyltransferase involved in cell wall biosynthesis
VKSPSRLRLLVLTSYWPSAAHPVSGVFVQQQLAALSALGVDVQIIAPRPAPRRLWKRPVYADHAGIPVHSPAYFCLPSLESAPATVLGFNARSCERAVARAARLVRETFRPDVVHVHGVRYTGMLIPYIKPWFDCKVLWTLHGVDPYLQRHLDARPARRLLERAARMADCTTVVGRTLTPYAERLGVDVATLRVVPNGTEVPVRSTSSQALRERYAGKRILLSVSNLDRDKGVHLNLQALARLDDDGVVYLVIGDGPERKALERETSTLGLQQRVRFLGRLPHPETMAYMDACDVFCLPSRREAFGIVYIEAMIRGKPTIGCAGTGAAEIITPGIDGYLVREDDGAQLAALLGTLFRDAGLRHTLGEAAAVKASRFTWQANAAAYLSLYDALVQGSEVARAVATEDSNLMASQSDRPA